MSRSKPSGLATKLGEVYTLHFWPKLSHAGHYSGWTEPGRVPRRNVEHTLGRGARITQAQREAGGWWLIADVQPGTRDRETQLKERGASRRCPVCKVEKAYQAGEIDAEEALKAVGWEQSGQQERELMLDMFGLTEPPEGCSPVRAPLPDSRPEAIDTWTPKETHEPEMTPENLAVLEALEEKWQAEKEARMQEMEMENG